MGCFIGLMSGTSADGIDAAAVDFTADGRMQSLRATRHQPYPPALRNRLLAASIRLEPLTAGEWAALDADVGEAFADTAVGLMTEAGFAPPDIVAIGSHGQTIFHDGNRRMTMQIGDPNRIAARTGIDTVSDFRRLDLALGGQGAPLVPGFHAAAFGSRAERRCIVNLGGIANITVLPEPGTGEVIGFDTGPANTLLDEWAQRTLGEPCDFDGRLAAGGSVVPALVDALLGEPYFHRPAPKSTGRDQFNVAWAARRFPGIAALNPADVQASFVRLTAHSVRDAIFGAAAGVDRIIVCGGGTRNPVLMQALRTALAPIPVDCTDQHGVPAAWVESIAFAWLAMRRHQGLPGNLVSVTGARALASLGAYILATPRH